MRQAFGRGFWVGGALGGAMTATRGQASRRATFRTERDADAGADPDGPCVAAIRRRTGGSRSTSSRRSSCRATGRATTSRATSASSGTCRASSASCGRRMCPAQVYEVEGADGDGTVDGRAHAVELRPVRRDHREGRPADAARGRLGARVPADVSAADGSAAPADRALVVGPLAMPGFLLVLIGVRQRRPLFLLGGAVLLGLAVKRIERPRVAAPAGGGGARRIGSDRARAAVGAGASGRTGAGRRW